MSVFTETHTLEVLCPSFITVGSPRVLVSFGETLPSGFGSIVRVTVPGPRLGSWEEVSRGQTNRYHDPSKTDRSLGSPRCGLLRGSLSGSLTSGLTFVSSSGDWTDIGVSWCQGLF